MIKLRALEPEDLELLYIVENDTMLWPEGSTNEPYSHFALRQFIECCTNDIYTDRQLRLVIEDEQDDGTAGPDANGHDKGTTRPRTVIGMIDLYNFSPENRRAEVGVMILQPYRGRGYCGEALAAIESYGSKVLHLHQLYAAIAVSNTVCRHAFCSAGYREQATLSQWLWRGDKYEDVVVTQKILRNIP